MAKSKEIKMDLSVSKNKANGQFMIHLPKKKLMKFYEEDPPKKVRVSFWK